MIQLDTHVVVWLFQGRRELFPPGVAAVLDASVPRISPVVRLELALLHEIGRLAVGAHALIATLEAQIGLRQAEAPLERVSGIACGLTWTRDPFDRLIAAHALADDVPLITRDALLLEHCPVARWDRVA